MRNFLLPSVVVACALVAGCARSKAEARPDATPSGASAPAPAAPAAAATPVPASATAPAGGARKLNKYTGDKAAADQGRALFLQYGCSGCHGAGGGGGMAPAVIDDVWKFGSDDETLFKLIKGQLPDQTMPRVYAEMPDDEVWKILAWIRTQYAGDPAKVNW